MTPRNRYPRADRVLEVYYALRMEWPGCAGGEYTGASRSRRDSECSDTVSFMCDVGRCLETLTRRECDEVLPRRWHAHFLAEVANEQRRRFHLTTLYSPRRDKAYKMARKAETIARWIAEAWDAECKRLSKRPEYQNAMRRLAAELEARDLYARASVGDRAGMVMPPEWTAVGG